MNPVGPGVHPRPSSERALGAARVSVIAEVHALEHPRHDVEGGRGTVGERFADAPHALVDLPSVRLGESGRVD